MPATLRTTLCETRDTLRRLRAVIATREHIESMKDIDTLLNVAEGEAVRAITAIDVAKSP